MAKTILDISSPNRPYERLEQFGPGGLSDMELIAILLKTGTSGLSALELATEVLKLDLRKQGLSFLQDVTTQELCSCKGLGRVKAITLKAAIELGKRSMKLDPYWKNPQIKSPKDAIELFQAEMVHLVKEEVHIIFLDTKHRVLKQMMISSGGLSGASLYPREVFRLAIKLNSAGIILAHNHPSGDPQPSMEDIRTTKSLIQVGNLVGIDLVDHIIVGRGSSISLKEKGYM